MFFYTEIKNSKQMVLISNISLPNKDNQSSRSRVLNLNLSQKILSSVYNSTHRRLDTGLLVIDNVHVEKPK
ncbi:hypothetical protein Lalb_Chr10g0105041 [Lupinus albus]|uniref:Uncharacterized protein n=1 Tax=Lupinus albus TaxID=3870 RepID=A0A6A4PY05_LUPAL|nr:hypothetical protein Lalb_Chr10g0105041 [Lupinus albus]